MSPFEISLNSFVSQGSRESWVLPGAPMAAFRKRLLYPTRPMLVMLYLFSKLNYLFSFELMQTGNLSQTPTHRNSQFSINPFISPNHSLSVTGVLAQRSYLPSFKASHKWLNVLSQMDTDQQKTFSIFEKLHLCARWYKVEQVVSLVVSDVVLLV